MLYSVVCGIYIVSKSSRTGPKPQLDAIRHYEWEHLSAGSLLTMLSALICKRCSVWQDGPRIELNSNHPSRLQSTANSSSKKGGLKWRGALSQLDTSSTYLLWKDIWADIFAMYLQLEPNINRAVGNEGTLVNSITQLSREMHKMRVWRIRSSCNISIINIRVKGCLVLWTRWFTTVDWVEN